MTVEYQPLAGGANVPPALIMMEVMPIEDESSRYGKTAYHRREESYFPLCGFIFWKGVKNVAETQKAVLSALLDILREQDLVDNNTYDSANRLLHSAIDFPEFFWYPVCCQGKEGEDDGCTQDPR